MGYGTVSVCTEFTKYKYSSQALFLKTGFELVGSILVIVKYINIYIHILKEKRHKRSMYYK